MRVLQKAGEYIFVRFQMQFLAFCFKIASRDREIERLGSLLEGGRPAQAVNSDCCYKGSEGRVSRLQDEVNVLKKEKANLENGLKGMLHIGEFSVKKK